MSKIIENNEFMDILKKKYTPTNDNSKGNLSYKDRDFMLNMKYHNINNGLYIAEQMFYLTIKLY